MDKVSNGGSERGRQRNRGRQRGGERQRSERAGEGHHCQALCLILGAQCVVLLARHEASLI